MNQDRVPPGPPRTTRPEPTPARARTGWLAGGVPLTVLALFFGGLHVLSWLGSQSTVEQHTYRATVTGVTVHSGSGDIRVLRGTDGQVTVQRHLTWAYTRPNLTERVDGSTLLVDAGCALRVRCSVDYTVWVPASVSVRATTSSGDVTVRGVDADLRLSTSSGDIETTGGQGVLTAHTGSGSVTATGTAASQVRLRTGSGDIRMESARAPSDVTARTGSGEVDIAVPNRDRYRVAVDTGSGDQLVTVVQDPGADRSISVRTGSGDITVRYLTR
ncbi:MAG TPA: DUF4097 family beta strand repeat-containing protein [Mycobacteriales bacterium]